MEITTSRPISDGSFSEAYTENHRMFWMSGDDGSVSFSSELTGLSDNTMGKIGRHVVYLQYGENDPEMTPALLAEARDFWCAVHDRRQASQKAAWKASFTTATPEAVPAPIQALVNRYRTSERAWEEGDESAWAVLRQYGY